MEQNGSFLRAFDKRENFILNYPFYINPGLKPNRPKLNMWQDKKEKRHQQITIRLSSITRWSSYLMDHISMATLVVIPTARGPTYPLIFGSLWGEPFFLEIRCVSVHRKKLSTFLYTQEKFFLFQKINWNCTNLKI